MPVVRVASVDGDPESANPAAAVMAATLAMASGPIVQLPATGKIAKPEKTRPTNPNQLTVNQHVFPVRSMLPFLDKKGRVCVFDMLRDKQRPAKPKDAIFCAQRAWDQRTEGEMKRIEDRFQETVQPIINGKVSTIAPAQKPAIDSMFALWFTRTRYRRLDAQEIQLFGVAGHDLTKAQEENLEKNGYLFARMGGRMPARHLNGVQLQMRVNHYTREFAASLKGWGVVHAQSGEFIVPDVPMHGVIPLSPTIALVASTPDGLVAEQDVTKINSLLRAGSSEYYFARDLAKCPLAT